MGFWDFVYDDSYKIEARKGSASRRGRAALKVFALRGCARQVGIGAMTARLGEAAWMAWRRVSSSTTRCWQASGVGWLCGLGCWKLWRYEIARKYKMNVPAN